MPNLTITDEPPDNDAMHLRTAVVSDRAVAACGLWGGMTPELRTTEFRSAVTCEACTEWDSALVLAGRAR